MKDQDKIQFRTLAELMPEWKKEIESDRKFYEDHFKKDEYGFDIILSNGSPYGIEWERFDSYEKVIGWITHLREKNWFMEDPRYENGLISIAEDRLNNGERITSM